MVNCLIILLYKLTLVSPRNTGIHYESVLSVGEVRAPGREEGVRRCEEGAPGREEGVPGREEGVRRCDIR